jgi:hypothetical protein
VGGQHHSAAALPPGNTRYPLYRRLAGPQGRSEQMRKISSQLGFETPDRPARSQSLYRLSYPGPHHVIYSVQYYLETYYLWIRGHTCSCSVLWALHHYQAPVNISRQVCECLVSVLHVAWPYNAGSMSHRAGLPTCVRQG